MYRRGSASSTARPSGDYPPSDATNSNAVPVYNPYMTTAPVPPRQQQELDWYSNSVPNVFNPVADVKVAPAPSPYASTAQTYPVPHSDSNYYYNAAGSTQPPSIVAESARSHAPLPYSSSLEMIHNNAYPNGNTYNSGENLTGTMTSNPYASGSYNNFFQVNSSNTARSSNTTNYYTDEDFSNEPPLLEELGINLGHITAKSLAVLLPMSRRYAKSSEVLNSQTIEESPDLAGPLAFAVLLASELLLAGKIHFAYIYSLSLFSCIAMTLLLNLLSPNQSISIWTVISVLGYCLLPVNLVAAFNVFIRIKGMKRLGLVVAAMTILWCSVSATRLFEKGCNLKEQRWLVGYPCVLLYSCFLMITIF